MPCIHYRHQDFAFNIPGPLLAGSSESSSHPHKQEPALLALHRALVPTRDFV